MIVDKKQIEKICNLAEEIADNIKSCLTEDEMKFFKGFVLFNIKADGYEKVKINERGHIWVTGYTSNYNNFKSRNIKYINNTEEVGKRAYKAIEMAKEDYKNSLGNGAIAIKELTEIVNNL